MKRRGFLGKICAAVPVAVMAPAALANASIIEVPVVGPSFLDIIQAGKAQYSIGSWAPRGPITIDIIVGKEGYKLLDDHIKRISLK